MICDWCKKEIVGKPRMVNSMGEQYCHKCISDCNVCGKPVNLIKATQCNLCWEVLSRLDKFLESKKAKDIVWQKLVNLGVI
ncbi:hypothetical protein LCGC14_2325380 [marine sediment metagenome]|uniref:Uncharacterized protein n=1 Tax=marine sediment metagenome TaxID=412755 RepID=A0A0F9B7R2_9ZZZZ